MKEKILAQLKIKFPGVPNELLGTLADKMALKITAEDQIQGGITELENSPISITDYAAFLQKEGDKRATEATRTHEATLRNKFNFVDKTTPPDPKTDPPAPGSDPELAKQFAAMNERLSAFEKKEAAQKLQNKLMVKLGEKKIPVSFARGKTLESEDQIDAVLAEIETDFTEVKQTMINEGFAIQTKPIDGDKGDKKPATEKELDAVMSNIKI